ncbi:MAG: hypothetical protein LUI15_01440 [Firmicutes bacterium]|nr:hypothetical protein [Bacillota bacterium]
MISAEGASIFAKCLGVMLVIASCLLLSLWYSRAKNHTLDLARDAEDFISFAEASVRTRRDTCGKIIASYEPKYEGARPFWEAARESSLKNALTSEAADCYDETTRALLLRFAENTGTGYEEDELALCDTLLDALRENREALEVSTEGAVKTFYAVISFFGVCLIIITI